MLRSFLFIYFLLSVRSHVNAQNHFPRPLSYSGISLSIVQFYRILSKGSRVAPSQQFEINHRESHRTRKSIQSREPHTRVMENLFIDDIFLEN